MNGYSFLCLVIQNPGYLGHSTWKHHGMKNKKKKKKIRCSHGLYQRDSHPPNVTNSDDKKERYLPSDKPLQLIVKTHIGNNIIEHVQQIQ